jgi:hypothetical protein
MTVFDVTSNTSYQTLSAAITFSHANDLIRVTPGRYVENFPDISHSLRIEAVGGLASLATPQPLPPNGRAILNVPLDANVSLSLSGLVLSGAANTGNNGAGILFERGNGQLTINHCWIHDNQDGVLTGGGGAAGSSGMTVTIDHSEIDRNGLDPNNPFYGYAHNIYVGPVARLTITDSYIHDALGGHEIKSRAFATNITGSRIFDGSSAASYSIDLPNGGVGIISGNVIEKGQHAQNRYVVHFAGESTYPTSALVLSGNTIVNNLGSNAILLFNQSRNLQGNNIPATIVENTLYRIAPGAVFQDNFAPPPDVALRNRFAVGGGPLRDTSHTLAIPEPAGAALLPLALLATFVLRRRARR